MDARKRLAVMLSVMLKDCLKGVIPMDECERLAFVLQKATIKEPFGIDVECLVKGCMEHNYLKSIVSQMLKTMPVLKAGVSQHVKVRNVHSIFIERGSTKQVVYVVKLINGEECLLDGWSLSHVQRAFPNLFFNVLRNRLLSWVYFDELCVEDGKYLVKAIGGADGDEVFEVSKNNFERLVQKLTDFERFMSSNVLGLAN